MSRAMKTFRMIVVKNEANTIAKLVRAANEFRKIEYYATAEALMENARAMMKNLKELNKAMERSGQ